MEGDAFIIVAAIHLLLVPAKANFPVPEKMILFEYTGLILFGMFTVCPSIIVAVPVRSCGLVHVPVFVNVPVPVLLVVPCAQSVGVSIQQKKINPKVFISYERYLP